MRFLLIGKTGQVGWELQRTLATLGEVIPLDRPEIELSSPASIRRVIREYSPQAIINAAAYTAVDKAEEEPDLAMQINGDAPAVMSEEAKRLGALFVTYSTDYVFDGTKNAAYTEEDQPNPLSVYGKTKLAGDNAVRGANGNYLIFRTSWVYGTRGKNFLLTMMKLAAERDVLKVVDDQIGAPTWSRLIAETTAQVIAKKLKPSEEGTQSTADLFFDVRGIYNLTSGGNTSWYGFTRAIVDQMERHSQGSLAQVFPITSAEYPVRATRPKNSILDNTKLKQTFGISLPSWDIALSQVIDGIGSAAPPKQTGLVGKVQR